MAIKTSELHPYFGAEVHDMDLSEPMTDSTFKETHDIFHDKGLLLFRNQKLGTQNLIDFSAQFGEVMKHLLSQYLAEGCPEILIISNIFENGEPIALYDGDATEWHSDGSWSATPTIASFLYCLEAPNENGETVFAADEAAYASLEPEMKQRIEKLQTVHSLAYLTEQQRRFNPYKPELTQEQHKAAPDVVQPLVRTHPVTGRKSLNLGNMVIRGVVDMPQAESNALLNELLAHATAPQFIYKHRWQVGDLVCWDNRSTLHTVAPCDRETNQRLFYRTSVR